MKWLKRLAIALVALVVVLVVVAFVLPGKAHVERSVTIDRPPAEVFAVLNDMRRFNEWSPWHAKDPAAKYTYSGPDTGVGAKLAWDGDPDTVGKGSQEIVESVPDERVRTQLDFGPMGRPHAQFLLAPDGSGTRVTWTFDSDLPMTVDGNFAWNLMGRLMGPMFDSMLGPDYEAGLASLERVVESAPPPAPPPADVAPEEPAQDSPADAPPSDAPAAEQGAG